MIAPAEQIIELDEVIIGNTNYLSKFETLHCTSLILLSELSNLLKS